MLNGGITMADMMCVFLDLSDDTQEYLQQQQIDLYSEIQRELPDVILDVMSDPDAPTGSRDLATVILASAALVTALTPVIIRILNQFRPDSTDWGVEEGETHHSDGTVTTYRKRVFSKREYNQTTQQIQHPKNSHSIEESKLPKLVDKEPPKER
jgi:hypothetical protein